MPTESEIIKERMEQGPPPGGFEAHIDGVPLSELQKDPEAMAALHERTVRELAEEAKREERQREPTTGDLFNAAPTPEPMFMGQPVPKGPAKSAATNNAFATSLALDDLGGFENRKVENAERLVVDEGLLAFEDAFARQNIAMTGTLSREHFLALSPEEQIDTAARSMRMLKLRKVSPRNFALMNAMANGQGDVSFNAFEAMYDTVNPAQIIERKAWMESQFRATARRDIEQYAASMSFTSGAEAVTNIIWQDMTPVLPLLLRWGLNNSVANAMGIPSAAGLGAFWIGNSRQNMREGVVDMSPAEFEDAATAFINFADEKMKDPRYAPLITKYGLLELMEGVFTEDVFDGRSADNKWDLWAGNAETMLEALFSVMVMAKAGGTIAKAFTKSGEISASNVARASGRPEVASLIDEQLQTDSLAVEFDMLPDEAVGTQLPRPRIMETDIQELPDGTKHVIERSQRIREEILDDSASITGAGLTPVDKTNAVNRIISDLDLNDGAHVQGRMNTLSMKADGSGFDMRVVVGESAEGGYKNIEDALDEALAIDGELDKVSIMRVNQDGVLEEVFETPRDALVAFTKGEVDPNTAGRIAGGDTPDETFYLTYDREQFWHTIDKESFTGDTFLSGGLVPRALLSPNAKFGDEIYGSFLHSYMGEQKLLKNFDIMFKPFYDLSKGDKEFVGSAFEWMEQFGKESGRAPTMSEIITRYDGITAPQLEGIAAMREGMDTLHELFNRRLFRDWKSLDFKTARPVNTEMPTYHGKVVDDGNGGTFLDPETGDLVKMTRAEVEDLNNHGGRIMKLDMPVDVPNGARSKADLIVLRPNTYEVGELSTRPLKYHAGYTMRFYDDPYYIVKETDGVSLNGSVRTGSNSSVSEAIRTAGTKAEAERFAGRASRREAHEGTQGVTYKVVRANDLSQTESTLFQKQSIHREGRLFWDERSVDRLPDVNGNRATLESPTKSLERGIRQAARQLTHEDLLKTIKNAWKNDYGDLLDVTMLERFDLGEISERLSNLRKNTVDSAATKKIVQAKELIDYLRLVEGVESSAIPALREMALNIAVAVNRWTGNKTKFGKALEKRAMTMDPSQAMRSVAFNVFLVFRPVRQALLQSSQIGYLAALDPRYVASTALFRDAYALRRGLAALRKSGYDDGFSVKGMAKAMGISEKEYRVLLREFDRSGMVDLVDVHNFAGGTSGFRKVDDSTFGTVGYKAKQVTKGTRDWLQKWGFDFGEKNNVTFTYNLALRRVMKRRGHKSLLDMTRKDWNDLRTEASNLALGMVRPNSFGYQTGFIGVATQFLSFGHKAALGLLGANPAIKGADALKIAFGTQLLYGANMYGSRDLADQILTDIGVSDQKIPGTNISLIDFISAGIVDSTFNMLGDMAVEDWADIDLGFIAPGLDINRLWEMQLQSIMTQPTKVVFGAFGNIASNVLESYALVSKIHQGDPDISETEKFLRSAEILGSAAFPVVNDQFKAYMGYKMGLWYKGAGEPLPIRATMNGMIARGLFGARTVEELSFYNLEHSWWEQEDTYNDTRRAYQEYFTTMVSLFYDGRASREEVHRRIGTVVNLIEDIPEGVRLQFLSDVMNDVVQDDVTHDSLYKLIVEKAVANPRVDPTQFVHLIDRLSIPPEKKAELIKVINESHEQKVYTENQILEQIEDGN